MSKVKKGKDWIDEGPSGHQSVYGKATRGGSTIGKATPVLTPGSLTIQTKAHRERVKRETEAKRQARERVRFELKKRSKDASNQSSGQLP